MLRESQPGQQRADGQRCGAAHGQQRRGVLALDIDASGDRVHFPALLLADGLDVGQVLVRDLLEVLLELLAGAGSVAGGLQSLDLVARHEEGLARLGHLREQRAFFRRVGALLDQLLARGRQHRQFSRGRPEVVHQAGVGAARDGRGTIGAGGRVAQPVGGRAFHLQVVRHHRRHLGAERAQREEREQAGRERQRKHRGEDQREPAGNRQVGEEHAGLSWSVRRASRGAASDDSDP